MPYSSRRYSQATWYPQEPHADDGQAWYLVEPQADAWWKRSHSLGEQSEDQETRVGSSDGGVSRSSSPAPWASPVLQPAIPHRTPREEGDSSEELIRRTPLATRTKLSTKAAAFVPKCDPCGIPQGGSRNFPEGMSEDSLSKVRASVEATFGACLMGLQVALTAMGGFEIRLELPPPPTGSSLQGARRLAADILVEALQHFGPRVVQLDVADDLLTADFQYLPIDPQCCCWEFVKLGFCPRMQYGQQCRWPHMKAVEFKFTLSIQEAVVVPPPSQFMPAFFGSLPEGFTGLAAPMQPAYTTTINGQQHTVMVVQMPMPLDFGGCPGHCTPPTDPCGSPHAQPQSFIIGGCAAGPMLPLLPMDALQVGLNLEVAASFPATVPKRHSWADMCEDDGAEIPTSTPRSDFGDF